MANSYADHLEAVEYLACFKRLAVVLKVVLEQVLKTIPRDRFEICPENIQSHQVGPGVRSCVFPLPRSLIVIVSFCSVST